MKAEYMKFFIIGSYKSFDANSMSIHLGVRTSMFDKLPKKLKSVTNIILSSASKEEALKYTSDCEKFACIFDCPEEELVHMINVLEKTDRPALVLRFDDNKLQNMFVSSEGN